jgi:hypothetical protein
LARRAVDPHLMAVSPAPFAEDYDEPVDEAGERQAALDKEMLFRRLKAWYKADRDACQKWREEAKEDYDFAAGHQWSEEDRQTLRDQDRLPVTFNRVLPVIKAVAGSEVNTRQDIQYLPREVGDASLNEVLTEAGRYLADEADAEDEESDAFVDCAICGMGWLELRLDYERDPAGFYTEDRISPFEMVWDASATKRNLVDMRRVSRAKSMDRLEAEGLFPDIDPADLDAAWAEDRGDGDDPHYEIQPGERRSERADNDTGAKTGRVTIVEMQWWERVRVALVIDPQTGEPREMDPEQAALVERRAAVLGMPVQVFHQMRRKYRRAFMGRTILGEVDDAPAGNQFSYVALTGDRDQNKGAWFGIVRPMRDPQRFANKWLSQTLDMLNRQQKGGVMYETGAVQDTREFEENYAKPGAATQVNAGALTGGKIRDKQLPQMPNGHWQLMEFAINSIRDSSGVNLEILGQQQQAQAGVLEMHRKQAAMNILATLFDALRRARKHIGAVRLYFIQNYLSDGRLVRITGQTGMQVIPLIRDRTAGDFDVVIDEAPSSPNQQALVWSTFVQVLPVIKDMITPDVLVEILPYSPFPDSFVAKMKALLAQKSQDPEVQQQKAMAMQTVLAKLDGLKADADVKRSTAMLNQSKAGHETALANFDHVDTVGRALNVVHDHHQAEQDHLAGRIGMVQQAAEAAQAAALATSAPRAADPNPEPQPPQPGAAFGMAPPMQQPALLPPPAVSGF